MKNSNSNPKANVNPKNVKTLSADLIAEISATVVKQNIQQKAQIDNKIFKKGFNEPRLRSKLRKKLFSLSKKILVSVKANDMQNVLMYVEQLENHCKVHYVHETKFDKIENYYTSQREDESTKENKEILSQTFKVCNSLKD